MEAGSEVVVDGVRRRRTRRSFSLEERVKLLAEGEQPGSSLSQVARRHQISPSVLLRWRHLRDTGGMTSIKAGEEVVPASEMEALKKQVKRLQRLVGEKDEELAVLKDAVEIMREKKLLSPAALAKLESIGR